VPDSSVFALLIDERRVQRQ